MLLARDEFHGREVAIKCVRPPDSRPAAGGDSQFYERFFAAEAALVGKLQHPNVVQILDAVADPKRPYLVMEYVPGTTLKAFCRPDALLPLEQIVEIGFKCAMALGYVARQGLIHRDVKPANVLIEGDGDAQHCILTDFGLMKNVRTTSVPLTLAGVLTVDGTMTMTGGTLDLNGPLTVGANGSLALGGGTHTFAGSFAVATFIRSRTRERAQ